MAGKRQVTVAGAGILGLWQALMLARAGHRVRLIEASAEPFAKAASLCAGAMLAPFSEGDAAPPLVTSVAPRAVRLWRETYPNVLSAGSLAVAAPRDRGAFRHFAAATTGHRRLDEKDLAVLEPALAGRFTEALFFPDEAHMATPEALPFLLDAVRDAGAEVAFGEPWDGASLDLAVDCRGIGAASDLPRLRGVRGERILIRTHEVKLGRPVRLLHPRHSLYVVPWGDGRFALGATEIESLDDGPVSVRSALDLLGAAFALHPAFGEAEIIDMRAGVRPAFADNAPRVIAGSDGRLIHVNGAYRHGFLLAPVLAETVRDLIAGNPKRSPFMSVEEKGG